MKKIAITASMGSGKTFIVNEFSKLGVPILIMDEVVRTLQENDKDLIKELSNRFPGSYKNGSFDKIKMREILFSDKTGKNLKDISTIINPYLYKEIDNFFIKNSKKEYVIIESALIFEYNLQKNFDKIIFVDSDPILRKEKAILRDNITSEDYDSRMSKQFPDDFKKSKCDYIIFNDFTDNVKEEVLKTDKKIKNV